VLVAAGHTQDDRRSSGAWLHFATGSNGGFMLARGFSAPGNLQEFVNLVVSELLRRGLSKTKYSGLTLRDNLLN
jgi:hypothetical protein